MEISLHLTHHMNIFLSVIGSVCAFIFWFLTSLILVGGWEQKELHGAFPLMWFVGCALVLLWITTGMV